MDGTALYECAGVLFIAQALDFNLTFGQQAVVVLTALLASIGAAAVPSAGLVVIFIVLEAVGLRGPQVEALVGFMLAVDRPLDMARTAVNVTSDTCAAAIIARAEGETEVDTRVVSDDEAEAA
jgi:Na+/H+-dicarboxylate symporter